MGQEVAFNFSVEKTLVKMDGQGFPWWEGSPLPTSQNFDQSPLIKILSLPISVPLHLVWHLLPSISQSSPLTWYICINYII